MYGPLLEWAHEALGWRLATSDSIAGPAQPEETILSVRQFLEGNAPVGAVCCC